MKKITKLLTFLTLIISFVLLISACNNSDDSNDEQNTPPTVSSNEIINQSIDKIEEMMEIQPQSTLSFLSFVAPNYNVDYAHERQSILNGGGIGVYFSKFLADPANGIEDNVTYKDIESEGDVTITVYTKKITTNNGVIVMLENHYSQPIIPIVVYFEYDFELNKPISTSIVQPIIYGDSYKISLAKFVFNTNMAYSYNIDLTTSDVSNLKSNLTQKTFTFDKFVANTITRYNFTKINTLTKTFESYAFAPEYDDFVSATYEQVETLYNSIYQEVKEACVPIDYLDISTSVDKEYYRSMYGYAINKLQSIMQPN